MKSLFLLLISAAAFAAQLPPPADRPVDFAKDIQPLLESSCVKCHAKGKDRGGLSMETHEGLLKGGDTGGAIVPGNSAKSLMIELVASDDVESLMPRRGKRWTPEQVGLLRAWIDQGAKWPLGLTFAKPAPENLAPRKVEPPAGDGNPVDRVLGPYFAEHGVKAADAVSDAAFARRVYLDTIGLLPSAEQLDAFEKNTAADKRAALVRSLLADQRGYADHWLTFWNDLLRNDYKGTGFIDGGRKQITGWLHTALRENKPYDRFVAELVNPGYASEGFTSGILWRGNVNASMKPPMQAAMSVSQVFLGVNLKCASCHDSFINDWALADCYGLAAVYSDEEMELVRCDKPQGKQAKVRFIYPEIGSIAAGLDRPARTQRLAELMLSPKNGRLARTVVNRLWARLLGRGLVEPLDDMDKPAWNRDVLDWLAEDLVAHQWDLKHTIEVILTSRAYALPSTEGPKDGKEPFVFRGPLTRRMTAEQFSDAVTSLAGDWAKLPSSVEFDFGADDLDGGLTMPRWIWTDEALDLGTQREAIHKARGWIASAAYSLEAATKNAAAASALGPEHLAAANEAIAKAEESLKSAKAQLAAATTKAVGDPGVVKVRPDADKHRVVFRRHFKIAQPATEAYAMLAASQAFDLSVNGATAKAALNDGFRNGRVKIYNIAPMLKPGDNVISISVFSHTDKGMNTTEREKYPESINHLNRTPGMAFHSRIVLAGKHAPVQIGTDNQWRVSRSPEGTWSDPKLADNGWPAAVQLPFGVPPVDEGPSLEPVKRKDFANIPIDLGPILRPAVSTAAHTGKIRAPLLAADPLQLALDRPNREIVTPVRVTSATTIQALELTNGSTLDTRLKSAAKKVQPDAARDPSAWITQTYGMMLNRVPAADEKLIALELLGAEPKPEAIADFLWAIVNLPEFQLIN
ncbi:MAG: DUF1549 domain-containing protein [Chthoniobacteraceae bacterium]